MDINELKNIGVTIELNNEPYIVIWSQHSHRGRRQAQIRVRLKNLISGKVIEKTFNSGEKIKEANIEKIKANYLYQDKEKIYLMNTSNYEQFSFKKDITSGKERFLKEGQEVDVILFNNKPINIDIPKKVELKVIETAPGVRGDSATNIMKPATLETGLKIKVPLFIKEGDIVRVNTETGEYVERV